MNIATLTQEMFRMFSENPLLARLIMVSVELALLGGIVALFIKVLRIKTPRLRALLWLLVLAKPIFSLMIGAPLPLVQFERPEQTAIVAFQDGEIDLDAVLASRLEAERALHALQGESLLSGDSESATVAATGETTNIDGRTGTIVSSIPWGTLILAFWIIGVCGFAAVSVYDQTRIRRLIRSSDAPSGDLADRFAAFAREMGIKHVPRLRVSHDLESPALLGLVRPVVLLPEWLGKKIGDQRLDWALKHELMHLKLKDPVALIVRRVAETLFFFHPVIWWSGKKWEEAMELACDRALLKSEPEARRYAEELYRMLENLHARRRLRLATGLFATRTQIGKRIAALMSNPLSSPARLTIASLIGITVLAAASLVIGLGFNQPSQAEENAGEIEEIAAEATPVLQETQLTLSEDVQSNLGKLGRRFRLITTALEYYKVDWSKPPIQLHSLTTPIAYIRKMPPMDPFTGNPMGMIKESEQPLVITFFSFGPDGKSDEGATIDVNDPELKGDIAVTINIEEGVVEFGPPDALAGYMSAEKAAALRQERAVQRIEEEKAKEAAEEEGMTLEEKIRYRTSRTRANLRTFHTAMEAYRVDWNIYPDQTRLLTTPIAYMTRYPEDPFSKPTELLEAGQPEIETPVEFLSMTFTPDWSEIRLYGIGPDRVDDNAEVVYDPTNGSVSSGDIMRKVPLNDYVRIHDRELAAKVEKQRSELKTISDAVKAWFIKHRALPESLEQTMRPDAFLQRIPEDIFAPGKSIMYTLDQEKGVGRIYSVGPDGDDDGGLKDIVGRYEKGQIPEGDIVVEVSLEKLEERFLAAPERMKDDPMLKALLELKEKDGKDNALIYYQTAANLMPGVMPDNTQSKILKKALKEGWNEDAEKLMPLLTLYHPMLEEIRKGAAVDYSQQIGWEQGPSTPLPNFLAAQTASKMLCLEGRYFESEGKQDQALDNYLTALTMGRDYTTPGGTLISGLIGIAVETISLNQVHRSASSGNLDRESLNNIMARISSVESSGGTAAEAMEGEALCGRWAIKEIMEAPESAKEMFKGYEGEGISPDDVINQIDRIEAEHKRFWDFEIDYMKKPYWERDLEAHEKEKEAMIETFHPINKLMAPNFLEADVRYFVTEVKLLLTKLSAALEMYKLDNKAYPGRLAGLVPKYLETMPVDPFSGKEFPYSSEPDGTTYMPYSIGPDKKDDRGQIKYDPTNGTVSGGDIFF